MFSKNRNSSFYTVWITTI